MTEQEYRRSISILKCLAVFNFARIFIFVNLIIASLLSLITGILPWAYLAIASATFLLDRYVYYILEYYNYDIDKELDKLERM